MSAAPYAEVADMEPDEVAEAWAKGIGQVLTKLRKQTGLTQAQMAERMNVSPMTLGRIERGTAVPQSQYIKYMAHLGVHPSLVAVRAHSYVVAENPGYPEDLKELPYALLGQDKSEDSDDQ